MVSAVWSLGWADTVTGFKNRYKTEYTADFLSDIDTVTSLTKLVCHMTCLEVN